jgi:rhomboid family GlyGly-CTERM serine protease
LTRWPLVAAMLALLSLAAWLAPRSALDWQPALAPTQPWRALSAAFVHWSPLHLGANLLGALVVAFFGWAARLPTSAALAWLAAWPLTQLALLLRPDLAHYGGMSGVLHAGVAVAATWLTLERRWIGALVLVGLALKIALEQPWGPPLQAVAGWDIPLAPLAHATGAVAGVLCALCARGARRRR